VNNGAEDEYDGDKLPNAEAQIFYKLLKETNEPLQFEGSTDSKLTVCIKLLGYKVSISSSRISHGFDCEIMLGNNTHLRPR
jgi:hypothetical protein